MKIYIIMNKWIFNTCKNRDLTLNNLVLPGTHNSCSINVDTSKYLEDGFICCNNIWPVNKIINNWSKNQNLNILSQLNIGVRMFDIDISYYNNEFYTSHTFIIDKLDNFIKYLEEFNEKSGDLFILKLIHRYNITDELITQIETIFNTKFKNRIIYPEHYNDPLNIQIDEYINKGKNMLIYMDNTNHNFYQIKYNLYSDWPNKQNSTKCYQYNKLKLYNEFNIFKTNNDNSFLDLNWTLTPQAKDIVLGILCCCCYSSSLENWVYKFNKKLNKFIEENITQLKILNSISVDFINEEIVDLIIDINTINLN